MTLTQINRAGLDADALDRVFTIGASGSSAYTFQGEGLNGTVNNPTLYLTRGKTYRFENGSGGHPIRIQSTSGASGTAYNTGVTNNAGSGTVIVEVQHDAPDVLYYQCTSHSAMNGILYITGALADGGVTTAKIADDAVTNAKIANSAVNADSIANAAVGTTAISDNAILTAKIANSQVTEAKLADPAVSTGKIHDSAVTTAKIADQAVTLAKLPHGTSSNDGKFLRANNGADPTFETVTGTTINNNADNRVITGSGTANTLEGESSLTYDGSDLNISNNVPQLLLTDTNSNDSQGRVRGNGGNLILSADTNNATGGSIINFEVDGSERARIDSNGQLLVGTTDSSAYGNRQMAVGDVSDSSSFIEIRTSNTGTGHLLFSRTAGANSGNYQGYIAYNQSSDAMSFHTGAGNQRARIDSDGLKFNADTAAANALDDYEEGTFSPFSSSYMSSHSISIPAQAHYIKIGRLCHIWFRMSFSSSNGQAIEGNMPFPCSNPTDSASNSPFFLPTFPRENGGVDMGFAYLGGNGTTTFTIYKSNSNYATFNLNSGLDQITVNGCYRTT